MLLRNLFSKTTSQLLFKNNHNKLFSPIIISSLSKFNFSGGPYNPLDYKHILVPEQLPTIEQMYQTVKSEHEAPPPPLYNMRHLHPVRQSGPIPPYDGTYTMEDIKKVYSNMSVPWDDHPQSTDIEQLMRRVPGLTRRQAQKIQTLGFTPQQQIDFAYLVVNLGIDVFYTPNQAYICRQVTTNSKGQKVQILWPSAYYDEMSMISFGTAPVWEITQCTWDPIPGELPIRVSPEYDLGVPYSWFEYQQDSRMHMLMVEDQFYIPESERAFPTPKNPHCSTELWRPQEDLKEWDEMRDPDWVPTTRYNVYNSPNYKRENSGNTEEDAY